jgi:hypothetical protein
MMNAIAPRWPARPVPRKRLPLKKALYATADAFGQALEVAGLVIFVAVLGTMPVIVAAFGG